MIAKMLLLWFLAQVSPAQIPVSEDGLTAQEQGKLAEQKKIDGRIKVYQSATERYKSALVAKLKQQEYASVPEILQSWNRLLTYSLQDIDKSIVDRRKKSKALIRYEIQLRKAISDIQARKTAAPVEVFDQLDTWLKQADQVRRKLVDIIFPT
jgi:predicted phage-related endonuclease